MFGPEILVRTLSKATRVDRFGNRWQYHSRSDHHSKVACWGIVFDLLHNSPLLKRHVEEGRVYFGINHEMRDFVHDRKKNLDLAKHHRFVPGSGQAQFESADPREQPRDFHLMVFRACQPVERISRLAGHCH
jgi:hypothetical protein